MRRWFIIGAVVLGIFVLGLGLNVLGPWLKKQLDIDRCLDSGGRWNYEGASCELADHAALRTQRLVVGMAARGLSLADDVPERSVDEPCEEEEHHQADAGNLQEIQNGKDGLQQVPDAHDATYSQASVPEKLPSTSVQPCMSEWRMSAHHLDSGEASSTPMHEGDARHSSSEYPLSGPKSNPSSLI